MVESSYQISGLGLNLPFSDDEIVNEEPLINCLQASKVRDHYNAKVNCWKLFGGETEIIPKGNTKPLDEKLILELKTVEAPNLAAVIKELKKKG